MSESAVRKRAIGIAAVVVLTMGACAASLASNAYAPVLIVLAVVVAAIVGLRSGQQMHVAAITRDEERALTITKGLVVALLRADGAAALASLAQGADSDGHRRAGGLGAPLLLAGLHGMKSMEASLRLRGAVPRKLDPVDHRTLVRLAKDQGLEAVANSLELMLHERPAKQERVARRAAPTRRFGSAL